MTRDQIKKAAKELQKTTGQKLGHCLEIVSKTLGYKDWNTASAMAPKDI